MAAKGTEQILIGALMRNPTALLQTEKYQIETSDFETPVYRYIYYAIYDMVQKGACESITVPEIENWLGENSRGRAIYESNAARQPLVDALEHTDGIANNVENAYNNFKRENVIRDLKKSGFDTSEFYMDTDNGNSDKRQEVNDKFNTLSPADILETVDNKVLQLKGKYLKGDSLESQSIYDNIEEMIFGLEESPEIGLPLQGNLFNHIISGALLGKFYLRSAASGVGKTRLAFGDAAYMAFPIRYNWDRQEWEQVGYNQKVLFIITEQDIDEVQKMAIAYLSDINESVFKRGQTNQKQKEVIRQAIEVLKCYQDNLQIVRVPNPSISQVKQIVREEVISKDIQYVFYDYIFESPALYNEFQGYNLRTDQILFSFSDALKTLAVELDIFIMSSTQVNAKGDDNRDIRGASALAGSRAIINKADMGSIMARPTKEELQVLSSITNHIEIEPNIVTDIFKLRGGQHTQVRIWSCMDLGTLKRQDLFVTNSRLEAVDIGYENMGFYIENEDEAIELMNKLNGGVV